MIDQAYNKALELLSAVNEAQQQFIDDQMEASEIFEALLNHILKLTDSEYGFIGKVNYEDGKPYLKTYAISALVWNTRSRAFYEQNAPKGMVIRNLDSLFGKVMLTQKPVWTDDPEAHPAKGGIPPGHPPLRSFMGVPIISRKRLIGMYGIANRQGGYSREVLQFLEPVTNSCAVLMEGVLHKEQELSLKQLKTDYEYLFALSPQPMMLLDNETLRFLDVNEAAEKCYGYTREEFLSLHVSDLRPEEEREKAQKEVFSRLQKGELKDKERLSMWQHLRKDGSRLYVEITSHEQLYRGRKARLVQVHDITEKVMAERELRESEANLKAAIDNGMLSITLLDLQGRIVLTDRSTVQMGLEVTGKHMAPGRRYADFIPPADRQDHLDKLQAALEGEHIRFTKEILHPGKVPFFIDVSYAPVRNDDEAISGVVLSFLDITRRRQAQEQLAESEANLQAIFDATSHTYFLLNRNYRVLKFNRMAQVAIKATHSRQLREGDDMRAYSDPKLMDSFTASVDRAFNGEKVVNLRKIDHPNSKRWYEVQYLPVRNDREEVYAVAFLAFDMTQHKLTEEALEHAYRRASLLKKALYSSSLIIQTDPNGNVTEVNDTFCQVSGYSEEEVLGQNLRIINSAYHDASFFEEMWQTIKAGKIWRNEIRNRARDGRIFWVDTIIHPVKDEEGHISSYFSVNYLINERKEAELEIKRYAQRLDDILENITDGFFTLDRNWLVTRVNKVFETKLGVSRAEIVGKNLWEVFDEAWKSKFYPEYHRTMNEGVSTHFIEYYPPLEMWFEANAYPAPDGISVYFRDITERRKREEEIKKLSQVARRTDNAVIITNPSREIEWVNEGFTKMSGYALHEVIGKNPGHFLQGPDTDQKTIDRIRKSLLKEKAFTEELINYNRNGSPYWIRMDINPVFDNEGRLEKFISIQSNITARKEAEAEKSRLLEDLVSKNQSLEEYAFITSHNLRAPIAHILGLTSLFNDDDLSDPFNATLIRQLRKSADNLDNVVKDLADLLSVRKNVQEVRKEVSLNELMQELLQSIDSKLEETQAVVHLDFSRVETIKTVKGYLYSMLSHLILNAIKYRKPERKPEIKLSTEWQDERFVCICVQDNGLGIDLDRYREKIFMLYQRFHTHVDGKGLGLHMIKTQAEALGGTIQVESKINEGSTFKLILPA